MTVINMLTGKEANLIGPQPSAFTCLGAHTYVTIIKEIEAINLKESKGGAVGEVGRRKGKGRKRCNFILISKNVFGFISLSKMSLKLLFEYWLVVACRALRILLLELERCFSG